MNKYFYKMLPNINLVLKESWCTALPVPMIKKVKKIWDEKENWD